MSMVGSLPPANLVLCIEGLLINALAMFFYFCEFRAYKNGLFVSRCAPLKASLLTLLANPMCDQCPDAPWDHTMLLISYDDTSVAIPVDGT